MVRVYAFYKFVDLRGAPLTEWVQTLCRVAEEQQVTGHLILSPEGVNGTVAGGADGLDLFLADLKRFLKRLLPDPLLELKVSDAPKTPFDNIKIVVRPEIITLNSRCGDETPPIGGDKYHHLSPEEWHQILSSGEDILLIDTRNDYEWQLGTFRGAVTPPIRKFSDLPGYLDQADLPKDKKTLIFCTGGVRCEKAIYSFQSRGFSEVYQLDGGILNYLKQYPAQAFEGECFVFDQRVAVTQDLTPSTTFALCPHCGDPGSIRISCTNCTKNAVVCDKCLSKGLAFESCSKSCRASLNQARRNKGCSR